MGTTVAGCTVIDANVATYVRSLLGDGMRTEGWELLAHARNPHLLRVRIVVKSGAFLGVVKKLMPYVRGFTADLMQAPDEDPGSIEINADLMVDINAALAGGGKNEE